MDHASRIKLSIVGFASFRLLLSGSGKRPPISSNIYQDMRLGILCLLPGHGLYMIFREFSFRRNSGSSFFTYMALVRITTLLKALTGPDAPLEILWCSPFYGRLRVHIYSPCVEFMHWACGPVGILGSSRT